VNAKVVLYGDTITGSIRAAVDETERRRALQVAYNLEHGIEPVTIKKPVPEKEVDIREIKHIPKADIPNLIIELETLMNRAAENLEFEEAIRLRDRLRDLREREGTSGR